MGQGMNDAQPAESMRRRRASSFAGFRGNGNSERRGSNAAERRGSNANADRRGSNANTDRRTASSGTGAPAGETHDHEEGFPAREREQMEECLNEVRGHLGPSFLTRLASSSLLTTFHLCSHLPHSVRPPKSASVRTRR